MASPARQPRGSCSNARRSALLLRFEPVLLSIGGAPILPSLLRRRGRPRSMMPVAEASDWLRRWPVVPAGVVAIDVPAAVVGRGSVSAPRGVAEGSMMGWFGVAVAVWAVVAAVGGVASAVAAVIAAAAAVTVPGVHGMGDKAPETGVGSVELVMPVVDAVLGVVRSAEADSGVKGVRVFGESSPLLATRAERCAGSTDELPDRSRVRESCLVRRWPLDGCDGITRGVRFLGDCGCRVVPEASTRGESGAGETLGVVDAGVCSTTSGSGVSVAASASWCGRHGCPGALMDRSWSGGRPGIVAAIREHEVL